MLRSLPALGDCRWLRVALRSSWRLCTTVLTCTATSVRALICPARRASPTWPPTSSPVTTTSSRVGIARTASSLVRTPASRSMDSPVGRRAPHGQAKVLKGGIGRSPARLERAPARRDHPDVPKVWSVRAVVLTGAGGPEVMRWDQVPDPEPGPGEVLVDVVASAVNRADLLQRQGLYDPPPGTSPYLGLECSGRVAALGDGVEGWAAGDEVCALLTGGGYAEQVAVPAGQLLPLPTGVDLVAAAGLPEVTCTVWSNVFMLAGLRPGETLLVHGGGSGIGTMAIQLGRAMQARVAVTAGSPEKLARCHDLGAEVLVDYHEQDFVEAVRVATDGRGADVVLDLIGAKYLARNVEVLATSGRLVVIGLHGGTRAELDLSLLMRKRAAVLATALRARSPEEKAAVIASVREHVWPLVCSGTVRPVVDRVLPMAQAAEAHRVLEAGEAVGKVLLAT